MWSFSKFQALGNDYILMNLLEQILPPIPFKNWVPHLCHRRFGIGSDGLLLVEPSLVADFKMRMLNVDGTEAEMCGNGLRCFAKFLYESKLTSKNSLCIETKAGLRFVDLETKAGKVHLMRVNMGVPQLKRSKVPMLGNNGEEEVIEEPFLIEGTTFWITALSMGNPHLVVFVEQLERFPVEYWGPKFSVDPRFPEGINIEFVQIHSRSFLSQRTWERGCGETYACGTGASAVCVAGILQNKTNSNVTIALKGGPLEVSWNSPQESVWIIGSAEKIYEGLFDLEKFFEKEKRSLPIDCLSV